MKTTAYVVFAIACLTPLVGGQRVALPSLYITHVTVVDVIAESAQPDMTVEIDGRTIASIKPARDVRIRSGVRVVDGRGKYLIPGLWDMHVHLSWPPGAAQIFLAMLVANGVLGV